MNMRLINILTALMLALPAFAVRIEQSLIEINAAGYNAAVRITPTNSAYAPADLSAPIMTGPTRIYTPVAGVLTISNLVEGAYTFEQAGKRLTFTVTNSLPTITNSIRELVSAGLVYGVSGPGFPGVVKATPTDTTPAVLGAKLVAGSNITITTNNASGNATLTITGAAAGGSDTNGLATTNYVNEIISSIASDAITNNDTRAVSFAGGSIALSGGDGANQWSITNVSAVEDEGLNFIGEAGASVARFIWNNNAPGIWAHNFYGLHSGLTNASGQTISTNITDSGTNIIVAGNVEAPNLRWLWQDIPNTSQMLAGAGQGSLNYHTNSVGVGYYSLQNSSGSGNSSLGNYALQNSPGSYNASLGVDSLRSSAGNNNSSLGAYSLRSSPGNNNSSLGVSSLQNSPGNNNSSLGYYSLRYSPGNNNSSLGSYALYQTTGSFNFAGGYYAGEKLDAGSSNVYIGPFSGPANNTSESNKLYIANAPGTPLIGGDFAEKRIDLDGNLTVASNLVVQGSSTFERLNAGELNATNIYGDGSGLTNVLTQTITFADTNTLYVTGAGTNIANGIYTRAAGGDYEGGWTNADCYIVYGDPFYVLGSIVDGQSFYAIYATNGIEGEWSSELGDIQIPPAPTVRYGTNSTPYTVPEHQLVGDGGGLTNIPLTGVAFPISGTNEILSYTISTNQLDNEIWFSMLVTQLNRASNANRFSWTNTLTKFARRQQLRVIIDGSGLLADPFLSLNGILTHLYRYMPNAGTLSAQFGYTGAGTTYVKNTTNWCSEQIILAENDATAYATNISVADNAHVGIVQIADGGTCVVETNINGGSWGTHATIDTAGAQTGVVSSVALEAPAILGIRVRKTSAGGRVVVANFAVWNSTIVPGLVSGVLARTGSSVDNQVLPLTNCAPIFTALAPDLLLLSELGSASATAEHQAYWLDRWKEISPQTDIVYCGNFPSYSPSDASVWAVYQWDAGGYRTNCVAKGYGYFCGHTSFGNDRTNLINRGFFSPIDVHPTPPARRMYTDLLWTWLGLDMGRLFFGE